MGNQGRAAELSRASSSPKTAAKRQWFQMTRGLVQVTIASTDLKDEALAEVEEAFIGAGLAQRKGQDRPPHCPDDSGQGCQAGWPGH